MLCERCIGEAWLRDRIRRDGQPARCAACARQGHCLDSDDIADQVERVINEQFQETSREPEGFDVYLAREGHWEQPGTYIAELISELVEAADDRVGELIRDVLSERHGHAAVMDGGEDPFAEDAKYEEAPVDAGEHARSWRQFKVDVLTRSRYYNRAVDAALASLFGDLHEQRTRDGDPVVRVIGPDSEDRFVYRARVAESSDAVERILTSPVIELGAPPAVPLPRVA